MTGYLHLTLRHEGRSVNVRIHRLVIFTFRGNPPAGKTQCRHLNGNQIDNRLKNLKWGTAAENGADRVTHRTTARGLRNGLRRWPHRAARGEANASAKITTQDVKGITALIDEGVNTKLIAAQYGVCRATVSHIKNGRIWKHVTGRTAGPHNQRLSDLQVSEIRTLLKRGFSQTEVARRYGVTGSYVWRLAHGKRRPAVEQEPV